MCLYISRYILYNFPSISYDEYVCTMNKVSNLVYVMVYFAQQQDNNSFQIFKLVTSPHILDNSPSISSPIYSKVIIHICMGIQRHCPFFIYFLSPCKCLSTSIDAPLHEFCAIIFHKMRTPHHRMVSYQCRNMTF